MKKKLFFAGILVYLCFALLSIQSCKTSSIPLAPTGVESKKVTTAEELFNHINSTKPSYSNLNIRFSAKIKTKKNGENNLRGKLKLGIDSVIWISAIPMGIEVARIIADQHEVGLINYLEKKYFKGRYEDFTALAGYSLTLEMLQSALTGSPFFVGDRLTYKLEEDRKIGYYFSPYERNYFERIIEGKEDSPNKENTVQALWFGEGNLLMAKNSMYDIPQKRLLEIDYAGYTLIGKDYLPSLINIKLKTPEETVIFKIEYLKTDINEEGMEYPFTIPSSYSQMELK